MSTIESDYPGPGQGMALEMIIDLASKLYEQGNTLTVRWVPGHKGVIGNGCRHIFKRGSEDESLACGEQGGYGANKPILPQEESSRERQCALERPYHKAEPGEVGLEPTPPRFETEDQSGAPGRTKDSGQPLLPVTKRACTHRLFTEREVEVDGLRHALVV